MEVGLEVSWINISISVGGRFGSTSASAWRLFCADADVDPDAPRGVLEVSLELSWSVDLELEIDLSNLNQFV